MKQQFFSLCGCIQSRGRSRLSFSKKITFHIITNTISSLPGQIQQEIEITPMSFTVLIYMESTFEMDFVSSR